MGFKWIQWMFFFGEVGVNGLWIGFVEGGGCGGKKEAVSQRLGNCFCDLESSG